MKHTIRHIGTTLSILLLLLGCAGCGSGDDNSTAYDSSDPSSESLTRLKGKWSFSSKLGTQTYNLQNIYDFGSGAPVTLQTPDSRTGVILGDPLGQGYTYFLTDTGGGFTSCFNLDSTGNAANGIVYSIKNVNMKYSLTGTRL